MAIRRMSDHVANVLRGWLPGNTSCLAVVAKLSANVTIDPVPPGRIAYLNSSYEFEMGLPTTNLAGHIGMFLWNGSDDFDVSNYGGDAATDAEPWHAAFPKGKMQALPCIGDYEVQTTEFDAEQTYVPGDCLTATASNSDADTGGLLTKGTAYAVPVCGVVSKGVVQHSTKKNVLTFYTAWLPKKA